MALHDKPDSLCSAGAAVSIAGAVVFPNIHHLYFSQLDLQPEPHRIANDACCLWLLIDCNFPLAIVGRRDSQTFTSCSSAVQVCDRELLHSGYEGTPVHSFKVDRAVATDLTSEDSSTLHPPSDAASRARDPTHTVMALHLVRSTGRCAPQTEPCCSAFPCARNPRLLACPSVPEFGASDTLISAFHSTLHGSEGGSPSCFVDSDVVCRHTVWETSLRELLFLLHQTVCLVLKLPA